MKLFLDMDGVLVDFVRGTCRVHRAPNPWADGANAGDHDTVKLFGMTPFEFWQPIQNHVFWALLQPTPECDAVVRLCERAVGALNVCLLSVPCQSGGSASGKMAWIKRRLPEIGSRFLIGGNSEAPEVPPKHFCAHPDAILIDDSDANVDAFRAAGGKAILFPRPWNSRHEFACEGDDWGDAVACLNDELYQVIRGPKQKTLIQ